MYSRFRFSFSCSSEVLPALRRYRLATLRREQTDRRLALAGAQDAADAADGNSGDLPGDAGAGGGGEQQLIVVAAMQGVVQVCARMDGDEGGVDFGSYVGLLAKVGEVGRKAVAEVDGRGGQRLGAQAESLGDAGLGVQMAVEQGLQMLGEVRWVEAARPGLILPLPLLAQAV